MKRICETCKYEDNGLFSIPCKDCVIDTNDLWEEKDEDL